MSPVFDIVIATVWNIVGFVEIAKGRTTVGTLDLILGALFFILAELRTQR